MKNKIILYIVVACTISAYGVKICNLPNGGTAPVEFYRSATNNGAGLDNYFSSTPWLVLKHDMGEGEVQNSAKLRCLSTTSLEVADTSIATIGIASTTPPQTQLPLTAVSLGTTRLILSSNCDVLNIYVTKRKEYKIGVYFVNYPYFLSNDNPDDSAESIVTYINAIFNNQANAYFDLVDARSIDATSIGESVDSYAEADALAKIRSKNVEIAIFLVPEVNLPDSKGNDDGDEIGCSLVGANCFIDNAGSLLAICHEVCHSIQPNINGHDGIEESVMRLCAPVGNRLLKGSVKYMDDYYYAFEFF